MAILDLKTIPHTLVIGGNVQAWDAQLDDIAALDVTQNNNFIVSDGANWTQETAAQAIATLLPVTDSQPIIAGSADATKLIRFEVDGLTTGTTRVLTPPDADINISGTNIANIFTEDQMIATTSDEFTGIKFQTDYHASGTSSRIFFDEYPPRPKVYGFSLVYAGNANPTFDGTEFTLTANTLYLLRHDNDETGATALSWDRDTGIMTYGTPITVPDSITLSGSGGAFASGEERFFVGASGLMGICARGTLQVFIDSNNNDVSEFAIYGNGETNKIFAITDTGALTNVLEDAATNTITNVVTIGHNTTGTAANSFGAGLVVQGESSTTADQGMGRLTYIWTTATHATRKARGTLTAYDTAERTCIQWEASGSAAMCGFFGTAPVTQRAKADYNNWAAFGDVVDALVALGLFDTA